MDKITVTIEGMMCGMCEAHICDAIRREIPRAKKVAASKRRGEATFLTAEAIDQDALKRAIDAAGYTCVAVARQPHRKRGLF